MGPLQQIAMATKKTFKIDLVAPWLLVISRFLIAGLLFLAGISNVLDFTNGIDKLQVVGGQSLSSVVAACLVIAGGFLLIIGYYTRVVSLVSIVALTILFGVPPAELPVLHDKKLLLWLVICLASASGLLLLTSTGSGPLSVDEKRSSEETKYDPELIRTQIWSWFFVVLGVLSIVFLSHGSTPADGTDTLGLTHRLQETGIHIGTALIIFGLFSLVLEFKDFSEYIAKKLSHLLIDKGYLETLERKQLLVLRQDVDRYALGASAAEGGGFGRAAEFYDFVNNAFMGILTSPFRKDYSETFEYFKENGKWTRNRDVQYTFVRGLASKEGGQEVSRMKITWGYSAIVDLDFNEEALASSLSEMDLRFSYTAKGLPAKTEKVFTLDTKSKPGNGLAAKTADDDRSASTAAWLCRYLSKKRLLNAAARPEKPVVIALLKNTRDPKERIEVVVKRLIYGRKKQLAMSLAHDIEGSERFDPDDSVVVNIRDQIVLFGAGTVTTLQMNYPTQNPTFHYVFRPPQSVVQTAASFHIRQTSPLALASPSIAYGETGVTIKFLEWLLPGHGIALSWTPQGNDDTKNAPGATAEPNVVRESEGP